MVQESYTHMSTISTPNYTYAYFLASMVATDFPFGSTTEQFDLVPKVLDIQHVMYLIPKAKTTL